MVAADVIVHDPEVFKAAILEFLEGSYEETRKSFLSEARIKDYTDKIKTKNLLQKKWLATSQLQLRLHTMEDQISEQQRKLDAIMSLLGAVSTNNTGAIPNIMESKVANDMSANKQLTAIPSTVPFIATISNSNKQLLKIMALTHIGLSVVRAIPLDFTPKCLTFDMSDQYLILAGNSSIQVRELREIQKVSHSFSLDGEQDVVKMLPVPSLSNKTHCLVCTMSSEFTFQVWDVRTGQCIKTLTSPLTRRSKSCCVAYDDSGSYLIIGADNGEILAWNLLTEDEINPCASFMAHDRCVDAVAFIPQREDSTTKASLVIASAGRDSVVRLWDLLQRKQVMELKGHTNWVKALAFHPTKNVLASAGDDGTVRCWDLSRGTIRITPMSFLTALCYNACVPSTAPPTLWRCHAKSAKEETPSTTMTGETPADSKPITPIASIHSVSQKTVKRDMPWRSSEDAANTTSTIASKDSVQKTGEDNSLVEPSISINLIPAASGGMTSRSISGGRRQSVNQYVHMRLTSDKTAAMPTERQLLQANKQLLREQAAKSVGGMLIRPLKAETRRADTQHSIPVTQTERQSLQTSSRETDSSNSNNKSRPSLAGNTTRRSSEWCLSSFDSPRQELKKTSTQTTLASSASRRFSVYRSTADLAALSEERVGDSCEANNSKIPQAGSSLLASTVDLSSFVTSDLQDAKQTTTGTQTRRPSTSRIPLPLGSTSSGEGENAKALINNKGTKLPFAKDDSETPSMGLVNRSLSIESTSSKGTLFGRQRDNLCHKSGASTGSSSLTAATNTVNTLKPLEECGFAAPLKGAARLAALKPTPSTSRRPTSKDIPGTVTTPTIVPAKSGGTNDTCKNLTTVCVEEMNIKGSNSITNISSQSAYSVQSQPAGGGNATSRILPATQRLLVSKNVQSTGTSCSAGTNLIESAARIIASSRRQSVDRQQSGTQKSTKTFAGLSGAMTSRQETTSSILSTLKGEGGNVAAAVPAESNSSATKLATSGEAPAGSSGQRRNRALSRFMF